MWYDIEYKKLINLLLPTFLRDRTHAFWLQTLLTPLMHLYNAWYANRTQNIYKLEHNGQVCYLRKVLNDQFDPIWGRIIITDGNRYKKKYIYTNGENNPKYLGTMYLRPSTDYEDNGADFLVLVPKEIIYNEHDMKGLIDFYKLASKRYRIEII